MGLLCLLPCGDENWPCSLQVIRSEKIVQEPEWLPIDRKQGSLDVPDTPAVGRSWECE